jgi:hypothetical protein
LEEPLYAEHVSRGWNSALETAAVFAVAGVAGAVIDGDLGDFVTGSFDEGGDEAVHAGEGDERVAAFATHGFEGAARIAHAVAGKTAADAVGDAALKAFESGVLAGGAVPADEVDAVLEFFEELEDISGIVLEIAIEEHDDLSAGGVDAGIHGGTLAGILFELEKAQVRIAADLGDGIVGGTVVDEDEFVVLIFEGSVDFVLEEADVFLFVVEGHDDREIWWLMAGQWGAGIGHLIRGRCEGEGTGL